MKYKASSHKIPHAALGLLSVTLLLGCFCLIFTSAASSQSVRLERDLDSHFVQHQTVKLDAATVAAQVRRSGRMTLATPDLSFDLELTPHDLRALDYRAEEFSAEGVGRTIDTGSVHTFRGRARGTQRDVPLPQMGAARFTIDDTKIEGLIITPAEHYFVEPARKYSKDAASGDYVIYKESDVVTNEGGGCGVTLSEQVNQKADAISGRMSVENPQALNASVALQELRIATEADNEYVVSKSGAVAADQAILTILNQVEGLYEIELGLTLKVSYQSAWSTANDPYSSTNASTLLGELSSYWNSNRGSVARDLVHMWTGKTLDNSTIGTAYLEALCRYAGSGRAAYGLSKGVAGAQQIAITAHEIGHNLGATHPDQQVPPVAGCDNTVMSSSVSVNPQMTFCQYSRDEIARYLAAGANCLGAGISGLSFSAPRIYPVGDGPRSVAVSDFNGDGKQDLATANSEGTDVSVLLGTDNDNFQAAVSIPVPIAPKAVVVGDFNGDLKPDLAIAGYQDVSVLLGNGNGTFATAVNYPIAEVAGALVVGDFNGDGKQDLATANPGWGNVGVLLGNGNGTFGVESSYVVSDGQSTPVSLAAGDFNGDNKQDLVVVNEFHHKVSVLISSGNTFLAGVDYTIAGSNLQLSVTVADFNGDGKLDFAVGHENQFHCCPAIGDAVSVFLNSGTGTFQPGVNYTIGGLDPVSITVGDFNADGKLDLAAVHDQGVSVLLGNGNGTFQTQISYSAGGFGYGIVVGDFNGDGKQDLATVGYSFVSGAILNSSVRLLLGTGNGAFQTSVNVTTGQYAHGLVVGDFNADGKRDLAITHNFINDPALSVTLGSGTGAFGTPVNYNSAASDPISVAIGDFNGDSKQDLVTIGSDTIGSQCVSISLGTGSGTFQSAVSVAYPNSSSPTGVAVGDYNRDGKQDLAVADNQGVRVLMGNGNGTFQAAVSFPFVTDGQGGSIAVGDFNSDGKQDLAVGVIYENNVTVLLGTGTSSFQVAVAYPVAANTTSVAVGDLNGDGKQDLAATYGLSGDYGVSVLLGNGNGTFQPAANYPADNRPVSVAIADFNGDGKQDLAVANSFSNDVSVLLGKGTGTFLPAVNFATGSNPQTVAVGDFNGDSKQDLAITNTGGVTVLLNTSGASSLTAPFNDNFSAARMISGPNGSIGGSTVLATKETNEPNHASASNGTGGASIWYRWTAPSTGKFYFQTFSTSFPSVLAVYTGASVGALTAIVKSTTSVPEYVEFNATVGTTYQIAIDGVTGDTGRTVLNWNTGSLSNDNFASAREIRGTSGSVNGDNTTFTLETNEPTLPGAGGTGFSAWYRWTAPNTGKVNFFTTPCGDTTRLLGAYTGNFMDSLSLVAVNYDGYRDVDDPGICDNRTLRFNAVAGTTYRIQMRSVLGKAFTLNWVYADPPANDNFVNALILSGNSGSVVGSNRDATKELGEPNHAGGVGGASVWYRWTATFSGVVTFDAIGFRNQSSNSFRYLTALMAVYTGSNLNALTSVVTSSSGNKVTFNASAGTTYQIAIDSASYSGGGYLPGILPLHWGPKAIANDDFAHAQVLAAAGNFTPLLGTNAGATKETGEPNHQGNIGGTSVWYRWTALTNGAASFVFNTCSTCNLSSGNALVAVYTGGSVNALTPVPTSPDNNHTFSAVRGTTYFIAVDSNTGAGGTYEFSLVSSNISARNDAFANAQDIQGSAGAVAGDNSGASKEVNEPNHANDTGGASVWYRWTAPASGLYTFDTFGSNFDTLLGVYTGNSVSALSTVASSDNFGASVQSRITFNAIINTTYYFAVDGKSTGVAQGSGQSQSQAGFFLFSWNNLPPPANDNFASAQLLSGTAGNTVGRNTVASKEGGEPNHAGNPGGASIWYRWTAPANGNVTFNTFGSNFNTLLAVYSGAAVNSLTQVSSNDDVGASSQSSVTFNAVAGTIYYVAVDGSVGVPGSFTTFTGSLVLNWAPESGISNDNFAQAQTLAGNSGSLAGTNTGAGKQNGEPNHAGDRGGRSVWYLWTAPFTGPVLFTTLGSDFDTVLAVYTGTNVNALTPVASNDDSPYADNLGGHVLTSSLSFTATAGTVYRIAVDGSGGRSGNLALRWGPEATISGQVFFIGGTCGFDKKVSMILSGEDARAVTFTGSGSYTFQHLRVGGNYSVRGVSEIAANCIPFFLERPKSYFPLAGNVVGADFQDDNLRGGGSTSTIAGLVTNSQGVGLGGFGSNNITLTLSGSASRTTYASQSNGSYTFPALNPGTYTVTPSCPSVVFSPAQRDYNFPVNQNILGANFVVQDSYTIEGQARDGDSVPVNGVTVTNNNGNQPVSVQTDASGYYSFNAVAGGSYTLTASKAGSTFTPQTLNFPGLSANQKNADFITPANQTISVSTHAPSMAVYNTSFTVAATSNSGLPVTYSSSGVCTNVGATFTMTSGSGTCTVRYDQAGDSSHNPATQVTEPVTAQKADQTITFGALSSKTFGDAPFNVSAGASSNLAVSFQILSGPATINSNTVTITGAGTVTVRASQAGDTNFNAAANVDQAFTVAKANQTITFGSLSDKTFGDAPFNVSAGASSNLAVSFQILSGPATISSNTVTITGAGTVTVRASQAGDTNFNAASNVDQAFTVAKANQTITFGALSDKTFGDPPFDVSASASSNLVVSFHILSGPATISGNTVTMTGAGMVTVRASQSGDSNFNAAANVDQAFTVTAPASLRIDTVVQPAGRTSGGQQLTLSGAFAGLFTVQFDGIGASWFYTNPGGDTSVITVTTPAHAVGAVQIDLTPTSGSPYSKANAFAYLPTVFTDDTLVVGQTTAKAQHIIELRQAVDAMRAVAGLSGAPWTDPALAAGSRIKAIHIVELRTFLDDAATRLGYSTSPYTDPSLAAGYSIKRIHIEELRQRIIVIAG